MKNNNRINPVGLKGQEINERMKELMGIKPINENKSNIVVELTKIGPDGVAYAIVRENHEYFIKKTNKKTNLIAEDFKYIGGLQNIKDEAYPSYAKAMKQLNMKFKSLAEAHNFTGEINITINDNLLENHGATAGGFSQYSGNGFAPVNEVEDEANAEVDGIDAEEETLTEVEQAVEDMKDKEDSDDKETGCKKMLFGKCQDKKDVKEHKLSILNAIKNMDAIIDSLTEGKVKKKVYSIR